MSDLFYDTLVLLGRHPLWVSSRPTVLRPERTARPGPYILAATHTSAYDIPLLMRHVRRRIDFLSMNEVFENRFTAWLYGSLNAFPLDRAHPDAPAVRKVLQRLSRGRVIGMFPEGRFRTGADSVVYTRRMRTGIGRMARLASVPILPCVIVNSLAYRRFASWLPLRRTRYAIAFGDFLEPTAEPEALESALLDAFASLHAEIVAATGLSMNP